MSVLPAPLLVEPSGAFDGVDGSWSSFTIRIGNPPSNSRVLVSTLIPETWVVNGPYYCNENSASNCTITRGITFAPATSLTWDDQSTFTLGVDENLGIGSNDAGDYGYDTVGIQITGGTPILLDHQVVVAIDTTDFWLGYLGLAPRTPQFSNSSQPSLLQSLKNQKSIPSLSYGFTAGASYRNQTGSLTLGGYDASMVVPNDVSFSLSQIDTHDIVVGLQSITFSSSNAAETSLLSYGAGFQTFIDSTLPNIWLPENVCTAFAQAFGLQYQPLQLRYTINDTMRATNMQTNASVTFQLANFVTGGLSVNITLPYRSFDLTLSPPIVDNSTQYFPIRQATATQQYTLGRAFLQEAYLTVDYGNQNFSVSQVDTSGKPSHIVAISDTNSTGSTTPASTSSASATPSSTGVITVSSQSSGLSSSAIAGIAIGIVAIAILAASAVIFVIWRNRRRRRLAAQPRAELPADPKSPTDRGERGYFPVGNYPQKQVPMVGVSRKGDELDGRAVSSPLTQHSGPNPIPMVELSGSAIERAELHSPEPDRSRSPTLVNQNRGSMITPTPDHGREIWTTTRLEMPSPGLSSRDSIAAADHLANPAAHSPQMLPSPQTEAPSPRAGSSTSAFQSPTIGYTRFGMTTPPPISPDSHQVVTPEQERESFL
ncbi:hypothetical protein MMC18_001947 [Xylographa bjoerkii]|nr:hypothetical protein [Xylographa bjoerkii]